MSWEAIREEGELEGSRGADDSRRQGKYMHNEIEIYFSEFMGTALVPFMTPSYRRPPHHPAQLLLPMHPFSWVLLLQPVCMYLMM